MGFFRSVKTVNAVPMPYHEAGQAGLVRDYSAEEKQVNGYKVVYEDGYESWSPAEAFEKGYMELDPEMGIPKKTLGNTCSNGTRENVSDVIFWGNGDTFKLISKASSEKEGWMKSTKAMQCGSSVVVQVTTQQRNPDGSYAVAEAVTTVPNAVIFEHKEDGKVISRTIA